MYGVVLSRLAERHLMGLFAEPIESSRQPVWPWDEHLATAGWGHFPFGVAVDHRKAIHLVNPEPAPHLDHRRPLRAVFDAVLAARRRPSHLAAIAPPSQQ